MRKREQSNSDFPSGLQQRERWWWHEGQLGAGSCSPVGWLVPLITLTQGYTCPAFGLTCETRSGGSSGSMQSVFCILWLTVYFILAPKALFHLLVTNQEKQQGSPKQGRRRAGKEGVWIFSVKANRSPLTLTPLFLDLFLDRKKKYKNSSCLVDATLSKSCL